MGATGFYLLVTLLLVFATICLLLTVELRSLPLLERKRRARQNPAHKHVYTLKARGGEAIALLWMLQFASLGIAIALIIGHYSTAISTIVTIILLAVLFGWIMHAGIKLPLGLSSRLSIVVERLAAWLSPGLRWVAKVEKPAFRHSAQRHHVYEKEDLLSLIHLLKSDPDVRIPHDDLQLAESSLTYGDKLIRYYMTPRRMIQMIAETEEVGPILLDELHQKGFSRLPVFNGSEDTIVGTLYVKDLLDKKNAKTVGDVMRKDVFYVHEDLSLAHALRAFIKTKHHMFMVVNQFQEIVGLITIEDILEQIIGTNIVDEFDKYDDLRAVAALHAQEDRVRQSDQMVQ